MFNSVNINNIGFLVSSFWMEKGYDVEKFPQWLHKKVVKFVHDELVSQGKKETDMNEVRNLIKIFHDQHL